MNYPLIHKTFERGPELLIPDPAAIKSTYENLQAKDPATPFPFWARIWPAATALTSFLIANDHLVRGRKVLEIGAGIGLPSFAITQIAQEVTITDHDNEAIELARMNIKNLGLENVYAQYLDWNDLPEELGAGTILLSDVNYAPDQFESLTLMIRRLLEAGSTLILSTPQRITASRFVEAIGPHVKTSAQMTINENGQSTEVSISVLSL